MSKAIPKHRPGAELNRKVKPDRRRQPKPRRDYPKGKLITVNGQSFRPDDPEAARLLRALPPDLPQAHGSSGQ
jgi:hypothetical protein